MKLCIKCQETKPLESFYEQSDRKSGSSYCKSCFNKYCVERWIEKKKLAIKYKGGSCIKCGFNKHYAALQFHHIDPSTKEYTWDKLKLKSWDKIVKELDKCELLCANCHSILHSS